MAKYDANWWFGKNSVWQQSGLKDSVTGTGDRPGGLSGFFDGLKGMFNKPVQVEHGPDDTMKYVIGGLVLYMVLKK